MLRRFFWVCFFLFLLLLLVGGVIATWGYYRITRDLPRLSSIEDYRPPAVTRVLAKDGTLIAEFYEQRRYPIKIQDVPKLVIKCFLAAEDASFYTHPGIDYVSILRAIYKNLQAGSARQGGSTITQQVVKNLLLTPERSIDRKLKEAILSYRLERRFTKDEILEIYLNQIYFGNAAYGIKAAARLYFHKEVGELSLAEASLLAGLPKAPSRYSPLENFQIAKRRQRYVLSQMVDAKFITKEAADEAYREKIQSYPASKDNIFHAPFFATEVRRILKEDKRWENLNIDTDGLEIHTTIDLAADKMAQSSLRRGLREVDKRRGWRGPLGHVERANKQEFLERFHPPAVLEPDTDTVYPAMITELQLQRGVARVDLGTTSSAIEIKGVEWAKRRLDSHDAVSWVPLEQSLRVGDVVEVSHIPSLKADGKDKKVEYVLPGVEKRLKLDQTPVVEGSTVLLDPHSGYITALQGGYDYGRSQFNRATQGMRQPGSTFKPIIYLAAIDGYKYTPATIVYDAPRSFRVGDSFWTPGNFDGKFLGPITLRTALEKSRNLISAEIVAGIGVDAAIRYARQLGIESPLGRNLSISLGSSEVTLLEMTRAYGVFAAKGILFDSVFITKVIDRDGTELFNVEQEKLNRARQAISENSAFIMANMMKGVVQHGTGYRIRELKRPAAGKTGTSNDQMDAWFIGYTPNWACGVWVGFDEKRKIGDKETGGVVAAPIWLYLMQSFLARQDKVIMEQLEQESKAEAERLGIAYSPPEPLEALDFSVPEGVDPFWVDKATGLLSSPESSGAFYEYFLRGTEPKRTLELQEQGTTSYLESPDL